MLPKQLKYQSKVESAPCKSFRSNIAPMNGTGTYNLGDTLTINIPTRKNLILVPSESYLRFQTNIVNGAGSTTNFRWDSCGAHGCIQRIRIFHGGNLLEDIDSYGMFAKMIFDMQVNTASTYGKYNAMCGTRSDLTVLPVSALNTSTTDPSLAVAQITAGQLKAVQTNAGEFYASLTTAQSDLVGTNGFTTTPLDVNKKTYCLNLISLIGSLCQSNYFPLFACDSAPLRVEIQLVDSVYKMMGTDGTAGAPTCSFTNVEYVGNFIELSDPAMAMIQESLAGQPLQFVIPQWRNYQANWTIANSGSYQIPIPAKFSSLKSLMLTCRDYIGTIQYYPFSSVLDGLASYYFRIGAQIVPAKAPSTTSEFFCEALKAMGSISDLNYSPSIDRSAYVLNASVQQTGTTTANVTNGSSNSGSFYIGLDLENYSNASKDALFAGYNSNTDDIYAVLNYGTVGSAVSTRYDVFAMFDSVIVFENQTAYVRF